MKYIRAASTSSRHNVSEFLAETKSMFLLLFYANLFIYYESMWWTEV